MWGSPYWHEFDLGNKSTEEVTNMFLLHTPGYREQMLEALRDFGQCMRLRDFAIPWIDELKQMGLKVLYLSNWSDFLSKANPSEMRFLEHMDGGVFSCDVHVTKPDREIYKLICDKYELNPQECIFIDDLDRNVEAACEYGIRGLVFEGYELTDRKVKSLILG